MRLLNCVLALSLIVGAAMGCSDDSGTTTDSQVGSDGPIITGDGGVQPDGFIPQGDGQAKLDGPSQKASALQALVNSIDLPNSATDYAADLDGDGTPENQFGAIVGAVKTLGFDMQNDIDWMLNEDLLIMLFEIFADSLTDDANAIFQFHLGQKTSTIDVYTIDPSSPADIKLASTISGGKLSGGPGDLSVVAPIAGTTPVVVSLKNAQVDADVDVNGMQNGVIAGALPMSDVNNKIIPAIAQQLDANYKDPNTSQQIKDFLKLLDTNKDGTIAADEIKNNPVIGLVIKADVDTDGDSQPDAMSIGMGFTAKAVTIQKS